MQTQLHARYEGGSDCADNAAPSGLEILSILANTARSRISFDGPRVIYRKLSKIIEIDRSTSIWPRSYTRPDTTTTTMILARTINDPLGIRRFFPPEFNLGDLATITPLFDSVTTLGTTSLNGRERTSEFQFSPLMTARADPQRPPTINHKLARFSFFRPPAEGVLSSF